MDKSRISLFGVLIILSVATTEADTLEKWSCTARGEFNTCRTSGCYTNQATVTATSTSLSMAKESAMNRCSEQLRLGNMLRESGTCIIENCLSNASTNSSSPVCISFEKLDLVNKYASKLIRFLTNKINNVSSAYDFSLLYNTEQCSCTSRGSLKDLRKAWKDIQQKQILPRRIKTIFRRYISLQNSCRQK